MTLPMLVLDDLVVRYGAITAVDGVSFSVQSGEVFAILGANGAGKSSLLRTLLGWQRPAAGRLRFEGVDFTDEQPWRRAARGIAAVPESGRVFADLTVAENVGLGAYVEGRRPSNARLRDACRYFPELVDRFPDRAGSLSGGQQQMVAIARAMIGTPRLLLVDEVTSGLAPRLVAQVFDALDRLRETGITLLIAEQNARRALDIADRAVILQRGRIVIEGDAAELRTDPRLLDAYLGAS